MILPGVEELSTATGRTPLDCDRLAALMSPERLRPYLDEARDSKALAADLYAWNIEIGGAMWDLLVYLEVAVRNSMARQLQDLRLRASPRHGQIPCWFNFSAWFTPRQRECIQDAKDSARDKGLTPGRVVAQLSFGFWVSLLDPGHTHTLWVPALRNAFPGSTGNSRDVHGQMRWVNELRNDIAHHNRIYQRDILQAEEKVLRTAQWIDSALADWMASVSTVREVNARRPVPPPSVRWGKPSPES